MTSPTRHDLNPSAGHLCDICRKQDKAANSLWFGAKSNFAHHECVEKIKTVCSDFNKILDIIYDGRERNLSRNRAHENAITSITNDLGGFSLSEAFENNPEKVKKLFNGEMCEAVRNYFNKSQLEKRKAEDNLSEDAICSVK